MTLQPKAAAQDPYQAGWTAGYAAARQGHESARNGKITHNNRAAQAVRQHRDPGPDHFEGVAMENRTITVGNRTLSIMKADEQRYWQKVDRTSTDSCWRWTASLSATGYGQFRLAGTIVLAHRVAWTLASRDLDPALVLDHFGCYNRWCVNPDHLQPATYAENGANRSGLDANNTSGVRGVNWDARKKRWEAKAKLCGRRHWAGYFETIEEAERAALQLRSSLGMANAADRARLAELHLAEPEVTR